MHVGVLIETQRRPLNRNLGSLICGSFVLEEGGHAPLNLRPQIGDCRCKPLLPQQPILLLSAHGLEEALNRHPQGPQTLLRRKADDMHALTACAPNLTLNVVQAHQAALFFNLTLGVVPQQGHILHFEEPQDRTSCPQTCLTGDVQGFEIAHLLQVLLTLPDAHAREMVPHVDGDH